MKKAGINLTFLYILFGIIIFLMLWGIIFFDSKKEAVEQNINKQSVTAVATIIPTSNSDLSYLMIIADPDLDVKLLDMSGNQIAEATMRESMTDTVNSENRSEAIKELIFQKPNTGSYRLISSGNVNKIYKVSIYFYDINGDVSMTESEAKGGGSFTIYFDKESSKRSYVKK